MATTQATARKVGRFLSPLTGKRDFAEFATDIKGETYYDQDALALQMTEDFGRSRRYWLCALSTGEDA